MSFVIQNGLGLERKDVLFRVHSSEVTPVIAPPMD